MADDINMLRGISIKHIEWKLKVSGSQHVSDEFLFQDRECHLEFFDKCRLYFRSCKALESPVTVTARVSTGSNIYVERTNNITGEKQEIWSLEGYIFPNCLTTFEVTIYPSKNLTIWPICTESLSEDFGKLFKNREHSDVVLKCGEEAFPAHRNVLSARSEVFSAMFRNEMSESKSGIVTIENMEPNILGYFLRYVYTGKVKVNMDTAIDLYKVANQYAVPSLKRKCASLIEAQLTEDTVCSVLLLAEQYLDQELSEVAITFAVNKTGFLKSDQWDVFSEEHQQLALKVYKKLVRTKN